LITLKKYLTQNQINEIRQLAKDGYSIKSISEKFHIGKSTTYYHAKDYCRKMTTFNSNLLDECEKGYIVGLFLGDGSFNKGRKEPRFFVRFALDAKRDKDISHFLARIFEKAGKKVSIFTRGSVLTVKVSSKDLVEYLQKHIDYDRKTREKLIKHAEIPSRDFQYGFLAGMIDSDGHVHEHLGTEIKTVSTKIFKNIMAILRELEISAKTKLRDSPSNSFSKKPRYEIYIPSAEMKRNKSKIPSVKIPRHLSKSVFSEKD
jgi:DNA-binding transcriptional regulator WhiA